MDDVIYDLVGLLLMLVDCSGLFDLNGWLIVGYCVSLLLVVLVLIDSISCVIVVDGYMVGMLVVVCLCNVDDVFVVVFLIC